MKKITVLGITLTLTMAFIFTSCAEKNKRIESADGIFIEMTDIPDDNYSVCTSEIPQNFYESITGENPSSNKGELNPVERVSYYDAIVFCNKLSIKMGLQPAYSVNGSTNPQDWNYTPHQNFLLEGKIEWNKNANGFRLPTYDEWLKAYKGGKDYRWSGSNTFEEVAWVDANSTKKSQPVKTLKKNNYGIYDMAGNVNEWIWLDKNDINRFYCGGNFFEGADMTLPDVKIYNYASIQLKTVGIRIVKNKELN